MTGKIFQPELEELIELRDFQSLREVLLDWTPADIAEIIVELPSNEKTILFRLLPQDLAIDTFEYLDVDAQMDIIKSLGNEQVASILNEMSPDDRTALLEELPAPITKQLIESLSPEERKVATTLLGYPEDSIGRLMTPDYIAIRPNWTVDQVLAHIRNTATEKETLNILSVVDERGKLIDDI
ncbi:partial Magnesium transporter MgtE, partial [Methylococcales bacterium]